MLVFKTIYAVLTFLNLYIHWRLNVENKPLSSNRKNNANWDMMNRLIIIFNSGLASLLFGVIIDPFFLIGFGMVFPFAIAMLIKNSLSKRKLTQARE
jgi:hypothetical protein